MDRSSGNDDEKKFDELDSHTCERIKIAVKSWLESTTTVENENADFESDHT